MAALSDGSLVTHWLEKEAAGPYAYGIRLTRSADAGRTWSTPAVPHRGHPPAEYGFVSYIPGKRGEVGVVWLDGRSSSQEGHSHGSGHGSMTLRHAVFDSKGRLTQEALIDERVCECCPTSAALTRRGAVVVYRDRSQDEVRDISASVLENGRWSRPQKVSADGWRIDGCPVNGPAVSARGDRVAVAWYTVIDGDPQVRLAFSPDGGRTFAAARRVDHGEPLGRVDIAISQDGSAWLSLLEFRGGEEPEIRLKKVTVDGTLAQDVKIAKSSAARASGFPRLVISRDRIFLAWTSLKPPEGVRTAYLATAPER